MSDQLDDSSISLNDQLQNQDKNKIKNPNSILENSNSENSILENSISEKSKKTDNCQELKNIAYKTMLQNGNNIIPETKNVSNDEKISVFLETESHANKQESWNKLDKTQKLIRLNKYVDNILREKHNLSDNECIKAKNYLQKCIERRNLQKTKEINYNKQNNFIENIPYLNFIETSRTFILKRDDKHISTIKSLPPEKKNKARTLKSHDD